MSFKIKLVIENAMKDPYTIEQTCEAINKFLTKAPVSQKQEAPKQPEPPIKPIAINPREPFVIPIIKEVEEYLENDVIDLSFDADPAIYNTWY